MKSEVSIEEYRKILNDYKSPEELIIRRLQYLKAFCRNIIKIELNKIKDKNKSI
jgi:hypothetical protein